MTFMMGLFIIILAGMAVGAISEVAKVVAGRRASNTEIAELRVQLEQYAAQLEEAQRGLAELQERVDFAERLLAQARPSLEAP